MRSSSTPVREQASGLQPEEVARAERRVEDRGLGGEAQVSQRVPHAAHDGGRSVSAFSSSRAPENSRFEYPKTLLKPTHFASVACSSGVAPPVFGFELLYE